MAAYQVFHERSRNAASVCFCYCTAGFLNMSVPGNLAKPHDVPRNPLLPFIERLGIARNMFEDHGSVEAATLTETCNPCCPNWVQSL